MAHKRKRREATKIAKRPSTSGLVSDSSGEKFERFRHAIERSNQEDLLRKVAGLQLIPANQNHIMGIIAALEVVSTIDVNDSGSKLQSSKLEEALNQGLLYGTFVRWLEDPPANLFTENVIFHGGNYVVYTGLYPGGPFILSTLLESMFLNEGKFTKEYVNTAGACTVSLLSISNAIATKAGHRRYIDGISEISPQIRVPKDDDLDKLGSAVSFSKSELTDILGQHGLGLESLRPFLTRQTDVKISGDHLEHSVLCWSPVIELEGSYVVIPSMIVDALIHFIITMSLAMNQTPALAAAYRDRLKNVTFDNIALLSHGTPPPQSEFFDIKEDEEVNQFAFKIDVDKLVYVQFICDDLSGIDRTLSDWNDQRIIMECERKQRSFKKAMRNSPATRNLKVLTLRVIGTLGRSGRPRIHRNLTLLFTAQDLYVLARIDELDWLALWKYGCLLDQLIRDGLKFLSFGPLDTFAAYYLNHRTFNRGEKRFDSVSIEPNLDRDLRVRALAGTDRHAVLRDNPTRYTSVVLHFESGSTPIYIPDNPHSDVFGLMIGGYPQPLWVSSSRDIRGVSESDFQFVQLIAHWLAAVNADLRPHLDNLKNSPIEVVIATEHFGSMSELGHYDGIETESRKVSLTVRCCGIQQTSAEFKIGTSMLDGTFDRQFMGHLLSCMGDLLMKLGIRTLTADEAKRIAEDHFSGRSAISEGPIFGRTSLLGRGLPALRPIQNHDRAIEIEKLVRNLTEEFEVAKPYQDKDDTNRICHLAVDRILEDFRQTLSGVSWRSLLERLIEQNEVICHIRARNLASIEQYARLYGYDTKIVDSYVSQNPRLDGTALAIRTLIEMCAAEPPTGNRIVSDTELDKLIAKSDQLMTWANLSERIYLDMSRPTIKVLESGIIEVTDDAMADLWQTFYRVKSTEDLERVYGLQRQVPVSGLTTTEEEREEAYKDEFDLTFSEIVNLLAAVTSLGLDQEGYCLDYGTAVGMLVKQLTWSIEEVELALSRFFLQARAKWDVPPDGYDVRDVYPWRFNRELSFMRRPMVSGYSAKGDRYLLFGPRQVEESIRYLVFLVETGRYVSRDSGSKMAALIGKINKEAGDRFTETVYNWFLNQTPFRPYRKVTISPKGKIPAPSDLGDIDVLAIDQEQRVVLLTECKNLHPARNPYEISQEVERVFGIDKEDGDGSIQKHLRRFDWITNNTDAILSVYGFSGEYRVLPIFVTSIEVPSKYMAAARIRFISMSTLQKEGLAAIQGIYS